MFRHTLPPRLDLGTEDTLLLILREPRALPVHGLLRRAAPRDLDARHTELEHVLDARECERDRGGTDAEETHDVEARAGKRAVRVRDRLGRWGRVLTQCRTHDAERWRVHEQLEELAEREHAASSCQPGLPAGGARCKRTACRRQPAGVRFPCRKSCSAPRRASRRCPLRLSRLHRRPCPRQAHAS
jgi:hypothetical protein